MQIVKPLDIELALCQDVSEYTDATCYTSPAPDALPNLSVCFMSVGGTEQTPVSSEYSVRCDVWAHTFAQALSLSRSIAGIVASLPMREPTSGRTYSTVEINATPYLNPDPLRAQMPRVSFRAEIGVRGESIDI